MPEPQTARTECDVIVVGARVAGSTLTALLGERGQDVLLIDGASFPSPEVSTHFFRGGGMVRLPAKFGLLGDVLSLGRPKLVRQYDFDDIEGPVVNPPENPDELSHCHSVRRAPLDQMLVKRACRSPTARFLQNTRVIGLIQGEGRIIGVKILLNAFHITYGLSRDDNSRLDGVRYNSLRRIVQANAFNDWRPLPSPDWQVHAAGDRGGSW